MRADVIVLAEPAIDDRLGLSGCWEPFSVEYLTAEGAVEALVISILPRRAGIDLHGGYAHPPQPILERGG